MNKKNTNLGMDLLGIKPLSESTSTIVSGVGEFLKIVCVPALEEFGLLIKDKIRNWRLNNIASILEKAKDKLDFQEGQLQIKAHPKVALGIIENGSLIDNPEIQDMWAGLFASSCTVTGQEDGNIIFVDLLKQLTCCEAKIIKYACENSTKFIHLNGLITAEKLSIELQTLKDITNINEHHKLDRELDHLVSLRLLSMFSGFSVSDTKLNAEITPAPLCLNLYVKCQDFNGDPRYFWKDKIVIKET
jgi:hypothetical protein